MFGKKRAPVDECVSCGREIKPGRKVCDCGSATHYMTFDERTAFEVEQWRLYQARAAQAS